VAIDKSTRAPADSGSVFPQADVATVVGTVFTGCPVVPDALQQLLGAVLLGGGTSAVKAVSWDCSTTLPARSS